MVYDQQSWRLIERSWVRFQLPANFFQEYLSFELVSVSLHSEGDYRENLNEMSYAALKDYNKHSHSAKIANQMTSHRQC